MPCALRAFLAAWLVVVSPLVWADPVKPIAYPETRSGLVAEVQFGERIADPYRWLENDVRSDAEVADWVARQNKVSREYLDTLPQRAWFAARMRELLNFERFGIPVKAGVPQAIPSR